VTEIDWEQADRYQLIKILVARAYKSAGSAYKDAVHSALQRQSTETLRAMVKVAREQEVTRQEARRQQRLARRQNEHNHTTTRGAR
jgi:hypothetical protein